jgi:hypothetical protein
MHGLRTSRLIALFVLGGIAINYPLLALFSRSQTLFGIPMLYVYLFGVWLGFIVLLAFASRSR